MRKFIINSVIKNIFIKLTKIINNININIKFERYPVLRNTNFSKIYDDFQSHNIEIVDFDSKDNFIYLKKGDLFFLTTPDYPWIIREVFCRHIYYINPKYLKYDDYVVFDLGMNHAYASLYFAEQKWCKHVYGFEIEKNTYNIAQEVVSLNLHLRDKISMFNFGLGNLDGRVKTYQIENRDGVTTVNKDFLVRFAPEMIGQVIETDNHIKKTSRVLKEIVEKNNINHIILKIDVEGAEYDIFDNIINEYPDFFEKVDIIIGEAHSGLDPLVNSLKIFGFIELSNKKTINSVTSDFLFVRE